MSLDRLLDTLNVIVVWVVVGTLILLGLAINIEDWALPEFLKALVFAGGMAGLLLAVDYTLSRTS